VNSAVFSPDGMRMLSASLDHTIKEWDLQSGACLRTFEGNASGVSSAVYSSGNMRMLSASGDHTIKEWDLKSGICLRTFVGHTDGVRSVDYSPDGKRMLSASWDKTIKEWDLETGVCLRTFNGHTERVNSAIYSQGGNHILSASGDHTIKEWDVETGNCLRTFEEHTDWVRSAVYSSDGRRMLSASSDKTIKEWDLETGVCLRTFEGHTDGVRSAVYSPVSRRMLSASFDLTIKEWDLETGVCLYTFVGHTDWVRSVVYSPDGKCMLSASWDKTIKEWDLKTHKCLRTFEGHTGRVRSAVYSSDGKRLLSASMDGTIKEWDRETGECIWTSPPYSGIYINGCDFKGCRFSSAEIEELVRTFGGNTLNPYLTGLRADTLQGMPLNVELTLDKENFKNLIITGPNGSGKTIFLRGVRDALDDIFLGSGEVGEVEGGVSLEFSGNSQAEAWRVLRLEYKRGYFKYAYFHANHLYEEGETKLFTRLDETQGNIYYLRDKREYAKADAQSAWLDKIVRMLSELLDTEVDLVYENGRHRVYYKTRDEKIELNRNNLPHGFSTALNIFGSILALWTDITIPFSRMRGLILIDELESHLHVRMQKTIFPFLTKELPNVQFIVTTHSPFILNSVSNAIVYDMERKKVALSSKDDIYGIQGWTLEEILIDILGQDDDMSKSLSEKINEFDKYTNDEDNYNASKTYYELEKMMHDGSPLLKIMRLKLSSIGGLVNDQNK